MSAIKRCIRWVSRNEGDDLVAEDAKVELKTLREALEPFANAAMIVGSFDDDVGIWTATNNHKGDTRITIGDLRRAATIWKKIK